MTQAVTRPIVMAAIVPIIKLDVVRTRIGHADNNPTMIPVIADVASV
jgi:hypothetical protein